MSLSNFFLIALPGGYEWILVILVVVLLFGGRKIPELMKGLGKGMSEFKKARKEMDEIDDSDKKDSVKE